MRTQRDAVHSRARSVSLAFEPSFVRAKYRFSSDSGLSTREVGGEAQMLGSGLGGGRREAG
jgi:hypothetical protein